VRFLTPLVVTLAVTLVVVVARRTDITPHIRRTVAYRDIKTVMTNLRNIQIFVRAQLCPRIFHFRTGETDGNADEPAIYISFVKCFPGSAAILYWKSRLYAPDLLLP